MLAALALAALAAGTAATRAQDWDNKGQPVEIRVLSSKPYLVSGETALVQVQLPPGAGMPTLQILVNGQDTTSSFHQVFNTLTGVVTVLNQGQNEILVAEPDGRTLKRLAILDYPVTGPVISGPQQSPFICQTQEFLLPDGSNLGPRLDQNCSAQTTTRYIYKSTATNGFRPLSESALPADIAQTTTLTGATVPYVVRVETGTIDRSIYQIAVLHDPTREPEPTPFKPPSGWNKRLIWSHGGGCPPGWYIQGNTTGPVLDDLHLGQGFAVASTSFNVPSQACNQVLSAEATMMTKARFIERFGVPFYTMSIGCSGGSYDSEQPADAYPGLYDGIVISCIFPDPLSIATAGMDTRLLLNYFSNTDPSALTPAQQLAVSGFAVPAGIPVNAITADRTDPSRTGRPSLACLQSMRHLPPAPTGAPTFPPTCDTTRTPIRAGRARLSSTRTATSTASNPRPDSRCDLTIMWACSTGWPRSMPARSPPRSFST